MKDKTPKKLMSIVAMDNGESCWAHVSIENEVEKLPVTLYVLIDKCGQLLRGCFTTDEAQEKAIEMACKILRHPDGLKGCMRDDGVSEDDATEA